MWNKIKSFNSQYIKAHDQILIFLIVVQVLLGFVFILINSFTYEYPANRYLPLFWIILLPFMLVMLFMAWWAKDMVAGLARFTRFYTLYYLIVLGWGVLISGIQLTPFSTIDHVLLRWDQGLQFNTPWLMAWTAHHSMIKQIFLFSYDAITWQLFFLPMILALFKEEQRTLNEYLFLIVVACIISAIIYYFLPTAAPSSVLQSPYFLPDQYDTALKFYQIHHYLQPTTLRGGLIAFPSDHVIFALICIFVTRKKAWLFIPVLLVNSFGILATVMLGWHYLIDVIASITIVVGLIIFLQKNPACIDGIDRKRGAVKSIHN